MCARNRVSEITISCDTAEEISEIFGNFDENVKLIQDHTGASIRAGIDGIVISGEDVRVAQRVVSALIDIRDKGEYIDTNKVSYLLESLEEGDNPEILSAFADVVAVTNKGRPVKCRTLGQKRYVEAIEKNTVVFGIGPAGTGKTYLAMAMAVVALKNKQVSRIILTRPAVEAGEKLGFLPGDMQNKVDPYLRPLYDALYDFMGADSYQRLTEKGNIEVAPLAYMRGRTLNDAFIILDEAQNCTSEQMKMFLTRFGEGSKVVVTGDITQIDLPEERKSGLKRAADLLGSIDEVAVVNLTNRDVVRHRLVREIIRAYEKQEKRR